MGNSDIDGAVLYKYNGNIISSIFLLLFVTFLNGLILFSSWDFFIKIVLILVLEGFAVLALKEQFYKAKFYSAYIDYRSMCKSFKISYSEVYKAEIPLSKGGFRLDIYFTQSDKLQKISFSSIDSFHFRRIKKLLEQKNVRVIDESGHC